MSDVPPPPPPVPPTPPQPPIPPVAPPPPPPGYGGSVSAGVAGEPPLGQPWYGAPFIGAWKRYWKKYATFSGRASRSEFWWAYLGNVIIYAVLGLLADLVGLPGSSTTSDSTGFHFHAGPGAIPFIILIWVFGLAVIVPSLAITWRRLHDTGRSGGWFFMYFIPIVGWIFLLVYVLSAPKPEGARFDV